MKTSIGRVGWGMGEYDSPISAGAEVIVASLSTEMMSGLVFLHLEVVLFHKDFFFFLIFLFFVKKKMCHMPKKITFNRCIFLILTKI
jgi:hypothetical protein